MKIFWIIGVILILIGNIAFAFDMSASGQVIELHTGENAQIPFSLIQEQGKSQSVILQVDRNYSLSSIVSKNIAIDWNSLVGQVQLSKDKIKLNSGEVAQIRLGLNSSANLRPGYYGIWIRAFEEWPRKISGQEIQSSTHQEQRLPIIIKVLP